MFRVTTASMAAMLAMVSGQANAADLSRPDYRPAAYADAALPYNWSGFYAGANLGSMWADTNLKDTTSGTSWSNNARGFTGGGQVGYNYQTGRLVLGIEGTMDWASMNKTSGPISVPGVGMLEAAGGYNWVATVAGRVGFAADNWLFYGKVGGAWVDAQARISNLTNATSAKTSDVTSGMVYGGGIEYGITKNWTARLEYDYVSVNNRTVTSPAGNINIKSDNDVQLLTLGINYKF